jgi:transcription termination/antitermination protein NusG
MGVSCGSFVFKRGQTASISLIFYKKSQQIITVSRWQKGPSVLSMTPSNTVLEWFALFVRTKHERTIQQILTDKGYEAYVPSLTVQRKWADRLKVVEVPLFPNYVFCRFNSKDRFPVVSTPEVYSVVGSGKSPLPIPDEEIHAIKRVVQSGAHVQSANAPLEAGELVTVISGPLTGLNGTVVRVKNSWCLVVTVTLLQRGVATEISRDAVRVIRHPTTFEAGTFQSMR